VRIEPERTAQRAASASDASAGAVRGGSAASSVRRQAWTLGTRCRQLGGRIDAGRASASGASDDCIRMGSGDPRE
jgi:hypothetical protein